MRPNRLLVPLALVLALAPAAPAAAFDWKTNAIDFEFQPAEGKIALGDSVTWNFVNEGHTTASVGGQPDSWRSVDDGVNPAGTSYTHVFNTPGRFQYICLQHKDFMKGVVEVGTDTVIDSIDKFRSKRAGDREVLAEGPVAAHGEARAPRRRDAQLHAAAAEARHVSRRPHGRGRLRQEDHPPQLLRHTLRP
jgi:plastocyanin